MVTTVLVVLMILALLEIVLLNGARLFFMIVFRPGSKAAGLSGPEHRVPCKGRCGNLCSGLAECAWLPH